MKLQKITMPFFKKYFPFIYGKIINKSSLGIMLKNIYSKKFSPIQTKEKILNNSFLKPQNEISCINKNNEEIFISGLCILSPEKKALLLANSDFQKIILKINLKKIYYFFSPKHFFDSLDIKLKNCFLMIGTYKKITGDKQIDNYIKENWVSLTQHSINFMFTNNFIYCSELKKEYREIDICFYNKKSPISLGIELFIATKALSLKKIDYNSNLTAINHENPILFESGSLHDMGLSENQIGQKNGDILCLKLIVNKVENSQFVVTVMKNYKDVKAYYKSSVKGHLTLIPFLNTEKEIFNKYVNNYVSLLKNFKTDLLCIDLLEEILDIKNDQSLPLSEKVIQINKLLFKSSEKVEFQEKGLNFSIVGDSGETDIEFQYLQSEIDKKVGEISMDSIKFSELFPNSCIVSVSKTKMLYLQIAKYLPENIQTPTIENLLKFYDNV